MLGPYVRYWLTINEPTVYVLRSYIVGNWPPLRPNSWLRGARVLRHMCRAHTEAYSLIHRHRDDAMVGLAHSAPLIVPRIGGKRTDRAVAKLRDFLLNDLPFRLLGGEPRRFLDFIGINYYVRQVIGWQPRGLGFLLGKEQKAQDRPGESRLFGELGWEIHPDGLRAILEKFSSYGVPLIVTENGIATSNEDLRTKFLVEHVRAVAHALQSGVDVRGYLYWTLFDNFEWTEGYRAKFGLAAMEPGSLTRVPRPAAATFESICRGADPDLAGPRSGNRAVLG
jgi:beta-glucosidase